MKVRKKPVVVDAVQNDGSWLTILKFLDDVEYRVPFLGKPHVTRNVDGSLNVDTIDGNVARVEVGWWLMRGIKGEFYPCQPDIFEETFEVVN